MNKRCMNLLKLTYDKSTAVVKSDIGTTRQIKILKGVKQRDILSALLFCIVIATMILKAESHCDSGYSVGGHLLSNLSYADDIAAIATSCAGLQQFLDHARIQRVWKISGGVKDAIISKNGICQVVKNTLVFITREQ